MKLFMMLSYLFVYNSCYCFYYFSYFLSNPSYFPLFLLNPSFSLSSLILVYNFIKFSSQSIVYPKSSFSNLGHAVMMLYNKSGIFCSGVLRRLSSRRVCGRFYIIYLYRGGGGTGIRDLHHFCKC